MDISFEFRSKLNQFTFLFTSLYQNGIIDCKKKNELSELLANCLRSDTYSVNQLGLELRQFMYDDKLSMFLKQTVEKCLLSIEKIQ